MSNCARNQNTKTFGSPFYRICPKLGQAPGQRADHERFQPTGRLRAHSPIIGEAATEQIAIQAQDAIFRHGAGLRICGSLDDPMREWPALAWERAKIMDQRLGIFSAPFTIANRARHERQRRCGSLTAAIRRKDGAQKG